MRSFLLILQTNPATFDNSNPDTTPPTRHQVYTDGDEAALTPDVGGSGTLLRFTEAVVRNLQE